MNDEIEFKGIKYSRLKEKKPKPIMTIYVTKNLNIHNILEIILLMSFGAWCGLLGYLEALKLLNIFLLLGLSGIELAIIIGIYFIYSENTQKYEYLETSY